MSRAERVLGEWTSLTKRAGKVYHKLDKETRPAFFQLVYMLCAMQTNLNKLYIAGEFSRFYVLRILHSALSPLPSALCPLPSAFCSLLITFLLLPFAFLSVLALNITLVGRSNLYAQQFRTAANDFAKEAIDAFYQDANLTETFHAMNNRKWDHMLDQAVRLDHLVTYHTR